MAASKHGFLGLAAALVVLTFVGIAPAHAGEGAAVVPASVETWASGEGLSVVDDFLRSDPQMREEMNPHGGALTLGSPTRELILMAPTYDLESGNVTSSLATDDLLAESGSYVLRLCVDDRPIDGMVLVSVTKKGNVSLDSFGSAFPLLADVSGDLGQYSYVNTIGYGAFGWDADTGNLVPLDTSARDAVGEAPVSLESVATAMAVRYAEARAVARIDGPIAGGGARALFPGDNQAEKAWQEKVAQGLAIPDDEVWTEEADAGSNPSAADEEAQQVENIEAPLVAPSAERGDVTAQDSASSAQPVVVWGAGALLVAALCWWGVARRRRPAPR